MSNHAMSFADSLQWLFARTNYENFKSVPARRYRENLGLLREFLDFIGSPDRHLCLVHVAGTKGKGSVSTFLESLLRQCGYRTGLFTSPHLESILERFMLQGQPCHEESFTRVFNRLLTKWEDFCRLTNRTDDQIGMTFFEWSVAIALELFEEEEVDCAILETGLGGQYDATNVCCPAVAVITSISYDHQDVLGETLDEIAEEKLGILKQGVPFVFSLASALLFPPRPNEVDVSLPNGSKPITSADIERLRKKFHDFALKKGAPAYEVSEIPTELKTRPMAVSGRHERWNAAIVGKIAECLRFKLPKLDDVPWNDALAQVQLPGRIERICSDPVVIIDGAHNRISVRALAATLAEEYASYRKTILFGASVGKDLDGMFYELLPCFDEIRFAKASGNARAVSTEDLMTRWHETMNALNPGHRKIPASEVADLNDFLESFLTHKNRNELLCVTGSFYLAGQVRTLLRGRLN